MDAASAAADPSILLDAAVGLVGESKRISLSLDDGRFSFSRRQFSPLLSGSVLRWVERAFRILPKMWLRRFYQ